ncbi:hypothetical protein M427DRAFT_138084 [Gonapodya prolifera JEL478]|uniref:Uncharacterized protein n=1 Tax=Gonapodya prolifera (strain JEL478) TaxID=1344416 RepID=A0A139A4C4_GONPJ|nr:hypothetical protein M427DRAFT_138084 [Gonapodya prolifera JEL478]|eukprot:KXS11640.1 hypothetical protein M427DRAFT_138084 [Gonapodya prolifera JEL478]
MASQNLRALNDMVQLLYQPCQLYVYSTATDNSWTMNVTDGRDRWFRRTYMGNQLIKLFYASGSPNQEEFVKRFKRELPGGNLKVVLAGDYANFVLEPESARPISLEMLEKIDSEEAKLRMSELMAKLFTACAEKRSCHITEDPGKGLEIESLKKKLEQAEADLKYHKQKLHEIESGRGSGASRDGRPGGWSATSSADYRTNVVSTMGRRPKEKPKMVGLGSKKERSIINPNKRRRVATGIQYGEDSDEDNEKESGSASNTEED